MDKKKRFCKLLVYIDLIFSFIVGGFIYIQYLGGLSKNISYLERPAKEFFQLKYLGIILLVYFISFIYIFFTNKETRDNKLFKDYFLSLLAGTIGVKILLSILTFFAPLLKEPIIYIPIFLLIIYLIVKKLKDKYESSELHTKAVNYRVDENIKVTKRKEIILTVTHKYKFKDRAYDVGYKGVSRIPSKDDYVYKIIELDSFYDYEDKMRAHFKHKYPRNSLYFTDTFVRGKDLPLNPESELVRLLQLYSTINNGEDTMLVTDCKYEKCFCLILMPLDKIRKYPPFQVDVKMKKLNNELETYIDGMGNEIKFMKTEEFVDENISKF